MTMLSEKIKYSRELLKLSQTDVANKLGYKNYQQIHYFETAAREPSIYDLKQLADILHQDISYFLNDNAPVLQEMSIKWRNEPNEEQTPATQARIRRLGDNYKLIETLLQVQSYKSLDNNNEVRSLNECKKLADDYIEALGLGARPAKVLKQVLEDDYGLKIFEINSGDAAFSGATISYQNNFMIALNAQEKIWRRNFSLAHELYHVITWNKQSTISMEENEKFAEMFASCLLLPTAIIKEEINHLRQKSAITTIDLIDLAIEFDVSFEALINKLNNMKIISSSTRNSLMSGCKTSALKRNRYDEYEKKSQKVAEFSSRYARLAAKCYIEGKISSGKLCELVGISRHQVSQYIASIGLEYYASSTKEVQLIPA